MVQQQQPEVDFTDTSDSAWGDSELDSLVADPTYGVGPTTQGREESGQPTDTGLARVTPYDFEQEFEADGAAQPAAPESEDEGGQEEEFDPAQVPGLDPVMAEQIRQLFQQRQEEQQRQAEQAQQPQFFNPASRQPLPQPPVAPDILDQQTYMAQRQRIAAEFLPEFRQAEQEGDTRYMRAVALRYEAAIEKLDIARSQVAQMYQMYQVAQRYEHMENENNWVRRQRTAHQLAEQFQVPVENVLVHPVTGQEIWDEPVMRATAAALALSRRQGAQQRRGQRADMPVRTASGGDAAPSVSAARRIQRMNPFSKNFDSLVKHVMAGNAVDPGRLPPRLMR